MAEDLTPEGDFTFVEEKRLKEKRANLLGEINDILKRTANTGLAGDDLTTYEARDAEVDALTRQIDAGLKLRSANRADAEIVQERAERTGVSVDEHDQLFRSYLRQGLQDMEPAARDKFMAQYRVQNTLVGSAGGFTVPDGFWNRLVEVQKQYGPIEQYVNSITTATGNDLPWLTNDDTANMGELLNEGDQVSNQDVSFNTKVLRAFTYSSKMILVSWQLLQDSAIDIEGLISRKSGMRLGRIHAAHYTTGDGVNKPEGITVGLTGGKSFAGATAITYDELIDIQHILDPAYRQDPHWMFNDATLKLVRKLVDGFGNKAWQPQMSLGVPDTLLGDPYVINQSMPAPTTGNVSVLYGDFNAGYIVRRVKGATAVRLNEKYADFLQTGFFVYDRADGKKDDTNAYTYGVQA